MLKLLIVILSLFCSATASAATGERFIKENIRLGDSCIASARYNESLDFYIKALERAQEGNNHFLTEECLGRIGVLYCRFKDYEQAAIFFSRGYKSAEERNDDNEAYRFACYLMNTYCQTGDLKSARRYFAILKDIVPSDKAEKEYYDLYSEGTLAYAEKQYARAIRCYNEAQRCAARNGMKDEYSMSLYAVIAESYVGLDKPDTAIVIATLLMEEALKSGNTNQLGYTYEVLSKAYGEKGDSVLMKHYRNLSVTLEDSIYNLRNFNKARSKYSSIERRITDRHISFLNDRITRQVLIIMAFVVLTLILVVAIVMVIRSNINLRTAHRALMDKNADLMREQQNSRYLRDQYIKSIGIADDVAKADDNSGNIHDEAAGNNTDETGDTQTEPKMSDAQTALMIQRIMAVLDDVDIISRQDFTLQMLANMIESNTSYVSWAINSTYGKNFKSLLNEARIREVTRRISDTEHYGHLTIQAIAQSVGYNSQTNFIKTFKRIIGMTPSMYQKLSREMGEMPEDDKQE